MINYRFIGNGQISLPLLININYLFFGNRCINFHFHDLEQGFYYQLFTQ